MRKPVPFDPDLAAIGAIVPEFENVLVGMEQRHLKASPIEAGPIAEGTMPSVETLEYEYVLVRGPVYERQLVWYEAY